MDTRPQGKVRYRIERSPAGMWNVSEEGFEEPIASFEERADALEYALSLADTATDTHSKNTLH